jgi:hypothetical protein
LNEYIRKGGRKGGRQGRRKEGKEGRSGLDLTVVRIPLAKQLRKVLNIYQHDY